MGQNGKRSNILPEDEDFDDDISDQFQHPQQRNAANARERARMRVLSKAFCRLKTTLPWVPPDTKLSKLDTLRLATSYIAHLRTILKLSENEVPNTSVQPTNMSWPFNFNVNWETQILRNENVTAQKAEWKNHETRFNDMHHLQENHFGKSSDYQCERRFSNHRISKGRRKADDNDQLVSPSHDPNHDFNYYKSYAYYET